MDKGRYYKLLALACVFFSVPWVTDDGVLALGSCVVGWAIVFKLYKRGIRV